MHNCPQCGYEMGDHGMDSDMEKGFSLAGDSEESGDGDADVKEGALADLMEMIESSLAGKFGKEKPKEMSVEMIAAGPKKDDEEEY